MDLMGKQSKHASQETSRMLRETKLVRRMRNLILGSGPKSTPGTEMSTDARRSEEHTSELSHITISYAVFCLKKKKKIKKKKL